MMDYRQNPHLKIIQQCAAAVAAGMEPVVVQFYRDEWLTLATREDGMPEAGWNPEYKYRIKPRTVTVHGVELPEPLRVAPMYEDAFWLATVFDGAPFSARWTGNDSQMTWLQNGIVHSTREAAEQWREFFLSMTRIVK